MRVNLYRISIFIFAAITILLLSVTILIVKNSKESKELNKTSPQISNVTKIQTKPEEVLNPSSAETQMTQLDKEVDLYLKDAEKELNEISNIDVSLDNEQL